MRCPFAGDRFFHGMKQPAHSSQAVGRWIRRDTDHRPGPGQTLRLGVRNRLEHALVEEVVDVDPHIVVIESDLNGTWYLDLVPLRRRVLADGGRHGQPVEKGRPALLQEGKECLPVRNDAGQRPLAEARPLLQ